MEFAYILLGIVAGIAGVLAIVTFIMAIAELDSELLPITLVCTIIALATGFGSAAAYNSYQTTWKDSSAVVRTVFNEGEDVMLLTKYGTVYRCVVPAQCSKLEKGDHVTFKLLPGGSSVPDTPDARNVVKG